MSTPKPIRFSCPVCATRLEVPYDNRHSAVHCTDCHKAVQLASHQIFWAELKVRCAELCASLTRSWQGMRERRRQTILAEHKARQRAAEEATGVQQEREEQLGWQEAVSDKTPQEPYSYRVFPEPLPQRPLITITQEDEQQVRKEVSVSGGATLGIGCLIFCLTAGLLLPAVMTFSREHVGTICLSWLVALFVAFLIAALITWAITRNRMAKRIKALEKTRAEADLRARQDEARCLTHELHELLQQSQHLLSVLPSFLNGSEEWLQHAQHEFGAHAYSPFWDDIEKAALALGRFAETVSQLSSNAARYRTILQNRRHSFPSFPVTAYEIPDPRPAIEALRGLVRKGQTNIDFAQIWEHHKTHKILILGFNTLAEVIGDAGGKLDRRLDELMRVLRGED